MTKPSLEPWELARHKGTIAGSAGTGKDFQQKLADRTLDPLQSVIYLVNVLIAAEVFVKNLSKSKVKNHET